MYINISPCKNDLRDSVHLALVIARMMVLAICACSPLQITRYESVILFESNIVNFMLLFHWGKMMTKLTNQVHCTWWHFSVACIWLILVGIFVSPWLDKQPEINCIYHPFYLSLVLMSAKSLVLLHFPTCPENSLQGDTSVCQFPCRLWCRYIY